MGGRERGNEGETEREVVEGEGKQRNLTNCQIFALQ